MASVTCFNCGYNYRLLEKLPRTETCPKCHSDLHCCMNCTFFDPAVANQCREPQAEYVPNKDRANFCEYFEPKAKVDLTGEKKSAAAEEARKAWEKLFKNI